MEWSAVGRNRAAVVGYNIRGDYYRNHPVSGFDAIGFAVSCTFQLRRRQSRQTPPPVSNSINEPDTDPNTVMMREQCMDIITSDEALVLQMDPQVLKNMLDPCPNDMRQAMDDFGRFMLQPGEFPSSRCFISTRSRSVRFVETVFLTQQCCYGNENG